MYCIKCGVKLADSEKKCPLCDTVVCHPDFENIVGEKLYPENKFPESTSNKNAVNGAIIILLLIPLIVCFLSDWQINGNLDWFGYVAGALAVGYITFLLPLWFEKRNPVIFTPCSFAATALYLLYINLATGGRWFLPFALPVVGGICLITSAVVTLVYYLKKGTLYIIGGAFILLGAFMLFIESLMVATFKIAFIGWSIYPLAVFALFGGFLIFLAINKTAREIMERKLFF